MAAQVRERQPWNARSALRPFPGWMLLDDAADELGISRQAVHRLLERGTIRPKDARTLGRNPDRQPLIMVRESAIAALPMTPQRRRQMELRKAADGGLGDELPEG